jgi:hypothetical protein
MEAQGGIMDATSTLMMERHKRICALYQALTSGSDALVNYRGIDKLIRAMVEVNPNISAGQRDIILHAFGEILYHVIRGED